MRKIIGCLLVALFGIEITATKLVAQFASAPITGAAIVTNGKFTNLYLYPNSDQETWDQHVASLHMGGDPYLSYTSEAIDGFTLALTQGWPGYFDSLMQYRTTCFLCNGTGISSPTFGGSARTIKSCVDAAIRDAQHGVIQYATLRSFANCHISGHDPSAQVNIFVSPDLKVAGFGDGHDICGTSTNAFHGWGINVPNFTVIPTNSLCNANFASLTAALSHEMVELLSDPAGFGYTHEVNFLRFLGNDTAEFNQDELGDICNGGPKNPSQDSQIAFMPFLGQSVSRYWSHFDDDCQPQFDPASPAWVNQTWISTSGSPLVRFTGHVHDWSGGLETPAADAGNELMQLQVYVKTGSADLRGGSGPNDNCDLVLNLTYGAPGQGVPLTIRNINEGRHWNNYETHSAALPLPPGTRMGDIASLTLHTNFGGGIGGDNWNVDKIALVASVLSGGGTSGTIPQVIRDWINASGRPLVRFTGKVHDWSIALPAVGAAVGKAISELEITVKTGGDDLRGGNNPSDNCDVVLLYAPGKSATIENINQGHHWNNYETHSAILPLPAGTKVGDIVQFTLLTHFGGGIGGDNWNVDNVLLQAEIPR